MTDLTCNDTQPTAPQHPLNETFVPPRDRMELQLVQLWQDSFQSYQIGVKDNLFDLSDDVSAVNRFISQVQQQFAPDLDSIPLQNLTIEQLAQSLRGVLESSVHASVVALQPRGTKPPFWLIPGADGNVFNFYQLAHHLGYDQPVYGFSARGLNGEQAPDTRIEDMAIAYLQALQTVQPQGPYLLGGHCTGSFVAFEMAIQLHKQGQEVAMLVMLDSVDPTLLMQQIASNGWSRDSQFLTFMSYGFEFWFNKTSSTHEGDAQNLGLAEQLNHILSTREVDLQRLELNEQLNYVLERAKRLNALPPDAKVEQLYHVLQVFKAMNQVSYAPQAIYPNRIVVLRAKEFQFCSNPTMGWEQWSAKPIEVYDVSGNHITMLTKPHVSILAQQLRACFDQV